MTFRKLALFPSSGDGRDTPTLLRLASIIEPALSEEPNRVGVFLPSPEDGNRSSLRNVVFLNKRTMDIVQNCDSYINIPSSQTEKDK
jgi:hypothetical protein